MNIEQMTKISNYLLAMSILFAIAAIIMFFVLDIPHCWSMITKTHRAKSYTAKQHKKAYNTNNIGKANIKKYGLNEDDAPHGTNITRNKISNGNQNTQKLTNEKSIENTVLLKNNFNFDINKEKLEETVQIAEVTIPLTFNTKDNYIEVQRQEKQFSISRETLLLSNSYQSENNKGEPTAQLNEDNDKSCILYSTNHLSETELVSDNMAIIQDIIYIYD